jgi:hypothetical protein
MLILPKHVGSIDSERVVQTLSNREYLDNGEVGNGYLPGEFN